MSKIADLHRMVMPDHLCPSGLKAKDLLQREGFTIRDHPLRSREEVDALKARLEVKTTPQIFIDGERIGGYDALRVHLGKASANPDQKTYKPVIALFSVAIMMAFAVSWMTLGTLMSFRVVEWFAAISMCLLAVQKLRDVESFSTMFLNYDLLARKWVPYGRIYPFAEAFAGIFMLAGALPLLSGPIALFVGTIGAFSVFKAVYVDKRDLKCACVGGDTKVPLGFVSLTENLVMVAMGAWVLTKYAMA